MGAVSLREIPLVLFQEFSQLGKGEKRTIKGWRIIDFDLEKAKFAGAIGLSEEENHTSFGLWFVPPEEPEGEDNSGPIEAPFSIRAGPWPSDTGKLIQDVRISFPGGALSLKEYEVFLRLKSRIEKRALDLVSLANH